MWFLTKFDSPPAVPCSALLSPIEARPLISARLVEIEEDGGGAGMEDERTDRKDERMMMTRSDLRSSSCPALTSLPAQALRQEACRARPKEKESLQEVDQGQEVEQEEELKLEEEMKLKEDTEDQVEQEEGE